MFLPKNHVEHYRRMEKAVLEADPFCSHGVKYYCRQCIDESYQADPAPWYEKKERLSYELPDLQARIRAVKMDKKSYKYSKRVVQEYQAAQRYRLVKQKTIKAPETDLEKFKAWRKSAFFSCKNYIEDKGIKFDKETFQDSFQNALESHIKGKNNNLKWIKEKGLPIQAVLNKKTRQYYLKEITRSKTGLSLEEILEQEEEDKENKEKDFAVYHFKDHNNQLEDQTFIEAMDQSLDRTTLTVAKMLLAGYKQEEIAKHLKVSQQAISRRMNKQLKTFLAAGVSHV